MTFEQRVNTTTITENVSTLTHVVDTRERHSFSKDEIIAALGVEVPEGYEAYFYVEEPMTRMKADGSVKPWKLTLLMTKRKIIS